MIVAAKIEQVSANRQRAKTRRKPREGAKAGENNRWDKAWLNDGWYVHSAPATLADQPLAAHADWAGPVKLIPRNGRLDLRREIFLGQGNADGQDLLDDDAPNEFNFLLTEIVDGMFRGEPASLVPGWQPPEAKTLAAWLGEAGHESAIDEAGHLRLTLKSRGCDGQVRVHRGPGRLRLAMQLGQWKDLDPQARQAMLLLAGQANRQTRLLRMAWIEADGAERCEAQVDLSGLPVDEAAGRFGERLWRDNLELAVDALQVALRQLGLELGLLAESRHRRLVELVLSKAATNVAPGPIASSC